MYQSIKNITSRCISSITTYISSQCVSITTKNIVFQCMLFIIGHIAILYTLNNPYNDFTDGKYYVSNSWVIFDRSCKYPIILKEHMTCVEFGIDVNQPIIMNKNLVQFCLKNESYDHPLMFSKNVSRAEFPLSLLKYSFTLPKKMIYLVIKTVEERYDLNDQLPKNLIFINVHVGYGHPTGLKMPSRVKYCIMRWGYDDLPNSCTVLFSKNTYHLKIDGFTNAPITFPKKLKYLYVYCWTARSGPLVLTKYLDYLHIVNIHEHKIFLENPMYKLCFPNNNIFIKDNLSDNIEVCISHYNNIELCMLFYHVRDKQLGWFSKEFEHCTKYNDKRIRIRMDATSKFNKNYPLE